MIRPAADHATVGPGGIGATEGGTDLAVHVVLIDPKYPHNVGGVVRAASCYGADSVWIIGNRVQRELDLLGRLP